MTIRLLFTGRSYHTAHDWPRSLELPSGATVPDAIRSLHERLTQPLAASCLVIVSGRHVGTVGEHAAEKLRDGDELLLLSPVAGG